MLRRRKAVGVKEKSREGTTSFIKRLLASILDLASGLQLSNFF